jgi:glucose/arabinose dehydrogenase
MSRRSAIVLALSVTAGALLAAQMASAVRTNGDASGRLRLQKLAHFSSPDYVAQPPGSKQLVYVAEQGGTIAVARNGHKLGHKLLDITSRVEDRNESGLSSMAFDPRYRHNRRFYVFYTRTDGNNEVDMFKRSRNSATRVAKGSRRRVILIPHPDTEHNGAQLQFGPDGHLYISSGDGGCCYDPSDHAYKLDTLLGKILRVDPKPNGGYTIPHGNPLVGKPGLDEIFAYGLRNPWRFSFDRKTGRIAIGDVGQDTEEEIDYETLNGARGANFGWPEYEGDQLDDSSRPGPGPPVFAIHTYPHGPGCAVIGGYVVRDPSLGPLDGRYVYSDNCSGDLRSFQPHLSGATGDHSLDLSVPDSTSFGEGYHGRIYVASLDGPVYRLVRR